MSKCRFLLSSRCKSISGFNIITPVLRLIILPFSRVFKVSVTVVGLVFVLSAISLIVAISLLSDNLKLSNKKLTTFNYHFIKTYEKYRAELDVQDLYIENYRIF